MASIVRGQAWPEWENRRKGQAGQPSISIMLRGWVRSLSPATRRHPERAPPSKPPRTDHPAHPTPKPNLATTPRKPIFKTTKHRAYSSWKRTQPPTRTHPLRSPACPPTQSPLWPASDSTNEAPFAPGPGPFSKQTSVPIEPRPVEPCQAQPLRQATSNRICKACGDRQRPRTARPGDQDRRRVYR